MRAIYLDSSALVKLYIPEPGSIFVRRALASSAFAATSAIAEVEVFGALARAVRGRRVHEEQATRIRAQARLDLDRMTIAHLTPALLTTATTLSERHFLRAYDAVHLASALHVAQHVELGALLADDSALREAAQAEGIAAPALYRRR